MIIRWTSNCSSFTKWLFDYMSNSLIALTSILPFQMCTLWFRTSAQHSTCLHWLVPCSWAKLVTPHGHWGRTHLGNFHIWWRGVCKNWTGKGGAFNGPKRLRQIRKRVKSCQDAKRPQAQRHNGHQKNTLTLANRLVVTILQLLVDSLVHQVLEIIPKYCQQISNSNQKPNFLKEGSQKSTPPKTRNQRHKTTWCPLETMFFQPRRSP